MNKTIKSVLAAALVLGFCGVANATALSAARGTSSKNPGAVKRYLMKASDTIYAGGMCMINSSGTAEPATASASNNGVVGVAIETVTAAASGNYYIRCQEGWYKFAGTTLGQDDVGTLVYAEDDQTVDESAGSNEPAAGILMEYVSASVGWVFVSPSLPGRVAASTDPLTLTGDLTLGGGAGALTFTDTASSVVTPDADSSALDIGSAGLTTALRYDSTDNAENFTFAAGAKFGTTAVVAAVTLDASDCGKTHMVAAAADGDDITLPATIAGCELTFMYVGADDGCDLDLVVNASDAIHGSCTVAAAVTEYNGTDDNDLRLSKATSNTGDTISLIGDGGEGWYIKSCTGIWVNF